MRNHCYLAGPFFNEKQIALIKYLEGLGSEMLPIYSPMTDGFVLKPDATNEEREQIFKANTDAIDEAYFVLAVIDDFDPGTIWEMGYAFGTAVPILAYSDVPGRGLNVMLAGSTELGFVNGAAEITMIFAQLAQGRDIWEMVPRNTWRGEIQ